MDIVTITHTKEKELMRLQSHSLDLFVDEPCTHWVIVEDDFMNMRTWNEMLSPLYKKHKLILLKGLYRSGISQGWHRQQLSKFEVAHHITSDNYLVLDTKNFFITQMDSIDQWPVSEGNGQLEKNEFSWKRWVTFVSGRVGKGLPEFSYPPSTPFVLKTNTVLKILKELDVTGLFIEFLTTRKIDIEQKRYPEPSEFVLYDFYTRMPKYRSEPFFSTFRNDEGDVTLAQEILEQGTQGMIMSSIHRKCFTPTAQQSIVQFLRSKGFEYDVVSPLNALVNYEG